MTIMKKSIFCTLALAIVLLGACKSKQQVTTAAYHDYKVECLGKGMDGTQTLKVLASGSNRQDAIEQAKKKAVYELTFTGIHAGSSECSAYPIVDEANARKKYEEYFDRFFTEGGAYRKYVSIDNQKKGAMDKLQGDGRQTFGIIVKVDCSALRKRYESDNIIVK